MENFVKRGEFNRIVGIISGVGDLKNLIMDKNDKDKIKPQAHAKGKLRKTS